MSLKYVEGYKSLLIMFVHALFHQFFPLVCQQRNIAKILWWIYFIFVHNPEVKVMDLELYMKVFRSFFEQDPLINIWSVSICWSLDLFYLDPTPFFDLETDFQFWTFMSNFCFESLWYYYQLWSMLSVVQPSVIFVHMFDCRSFLPSVGHFLCQSLLFKFLEAYILKILS